MSPNEDGPLSVQEEWNTVLLALHLRFHRSLLQMLVDKGIMTRAEGESFMFNLANGMRDGSDLAATQDVTYYFAECLERIGGDLTEPQAGPSP